MTSYITKRVFVLAALLAPITTLTTTAQEKITLQMAVDRTLANNLTIKQSVVNEAIGEVDLKQAKNNRLPSFNASTDGRYLFGRNLIPGQLEYNSSASFSVNGNAQLQLTIFQGGLLRNQILQNRLALDVNKGQTAKIKNDLILNVVTTYLQILNNQDLVIAAKQQQDLANLTLQRSDINFKAGNQTLADLAQAKAQVSTGTLTLTNAQNQLDLSVLALKQFMEMDPYAPIEVERPDISKLTDIKTIYDANEVVRTALNVNPDIRLAELQQKTYQQAVRVAKSYYYPTVSFFGGMGSTYSDRVKQKVIGYAPGIYPQIGTIEGTNQAVLSNTIFRQPIPGTYSAFNQFADNFYQNVGLSVQIPIFNRFNTRSNVRRAELNFQNAQLGTQISKNNLSKTIIQAILDLQSADKQYQSATQTFEANQAALNVTKQRYDVGLVNSLDYNTALTNYNRSQIDMIQARYSVIFRSKIIDYYLGKTITL
jgi:outer membrane protein